MKTAAKLLIGIAVLFLAVVAVFLFMSQSQSAARTAEFTGSIEAEEVDLNVKVPGRVARMDVEEGDPVTAGQIIAVLEADNIEAKSRQVNAAIQAANAQYEKAKKGARPQQLAQAKDLMDQAKAGYELAQSTYNRLLMLYKEGVLPEQKLDMARTDLEVAEKRYNSAKQQYDLVREGTQTEDLEAAAALVRQAQAAYGEVQTYLNDAVVKAPLSGILSLKAANKGELVSTGMPLATITDFSNVWVIVKVRETELRRFQLGRTVPVAVPGVPGRVYQGKITYIAAKPSFATERAYQEKGEKDLVSFAVKIKLDNRDGKLRPGMTASIRMSR